MIRTLFAAAAMLSALPAAAQTHILQTHAEAGATAGRSPHKAYRPLVQQSTCGKAMHSQPGGKLPHYGVRQDSACTVSLVQRDAAGAMPGAD